jgi:hypothetical protein
LIAREDPLNAAEPSWNGRLGELMTRETDPIGTVPQKDPSEIKWIASLTEIIATLPELIPPGIDSLATETEFIAPPVKN